MGLSETLAVIIGVLFIWAVAWPESFAQWIKIIIGAFACHAPI